MVQPVVLLEILWDKAVKYYPLGYIKIKNLGTQPLLLLDIKLSCHAPGRDFTEHPTLWDEHIIQPGENLCPKFDFRPQLEEGKSSWNTGELGYALDVVASDLSKRVVLAYRNIPVLNIANVEEGWPPSVRWRYFLKPLRRRYLILRYRFKRPMTGK
jgi:hypothetical protein